MLRISNACSGNKSGCNGIWFIQPLEIALSEIWCLWRFWIFSLCNQWTRAMPTWMPYVSSATCLPQFSILQFFRHQLKSSILGFTFSIKFPLFFSAQITQLILLKHNMIIPISGWRAKTPSISATSSFLTVSAIYNVHFVCIHIGQSMRRNTLFPVRRKRTRQTKASHTKL